MSPLKKFAVAAAVAGTTLMSVPASAASGGLDVTYDAEGSSHVASTGSTLPIAPTTLHTTINAADGTITGSMQLESVETHFNVIGFVPVSATVHFEEAAPVQGALIVENYSTRVETTASYTIRLSDIRVAGIPTLAGPNCRTAQPVTIPANTPEGEQFSIVQGGPLEGEFTIGNFKSCGLFGAQTHLINALIPGSGNTMELTVSNGRLG